jgi:hypothetical protein
VQQPAALRPQFGEYLYEVNSLIRCSLTAGLKRPSTNRSEVRRKAISWIGVDDGKLCEQEIRSDMLNDRD